MSGNQRFVLLIVAMALIGLAIMRVSPAQQETLRAADVPDKLVAKQFILMDDKGNSRARLGLDRFGHSNLVMLDEHENKLVEITGITSRGGVVEVNGPQGQARIVLGHGPISFPVKGANLTDPNFKFKPVAIGRAKSDYFLDFYGEEGVPVARYGDGYLRLMGQDPVNTIGNIAVVDKDGKERFLVGLDANGNPHMTMTNKAGKERTAKP